MLVNRYRSVDGYRERPVARDDLVGLAESVEELLIDVTVLRNNRVLGLLFGDHRTVGLCHRRIVDDLLDYHRLVRSDALNPISDPEGDSLHCRYLSGALLKDGMTKTAAGKSCRGPWVGVLGERSYRPDDPVFDEPHRRLGSTLSSACDCAVCDQQHHENNACFHALTDVVLAFIVLSAA